MSTNSELTAASYPLQMDGKTYQMSPFTDKDLVELDFWVQAKYINTVRESLKTASVSEVQRLEELDLAHRAAVGLSAFTGTGVRMLSGVEGMTRLVYQACKRNHPDVTEADFRQAMFKPENRQQVNDVFTKLNVPTASIRKPTPRESSSPAELHTLPQSAKQNRQAKKKRTGH